MERPSKPYVLLDRDGTVIVEKNYLADPDGVELLPGAVEGLRLLLAAGYGLVLITNQSGVGRGYFTLEDLGRVNQRLEQMLAEAGIRLEGIYICPHAPEQDCECRKPKPKLAIDAAAELGFDLQQAWMIGDKSADVDLARNAGTRAVLVRTGYGRKTEAAGVVADYVAEDLSAAAARILR